jgi:phosphoribosylamine---glycine ligase
MNILLLGAGGREHALAWKLRQSHLCDNLFISPGNAGTVALGKNLPFNVNDFAAVETAISEYNINMVVVGPEEPLVNGIYDYFRDRNFPNNVIIVAPSANGAQLEGSKAFSKHFMQRHDIPTAGYAEFTKENFEQGKRYISRHSLPIVLKADGLAAGKGVVIASTHEEALQAFEEMIVHEQFGKASSKVVIEAFLQGIEVSVFALTDGKDYKIIGHAKDYKRIGEGDTGPNTGGMGCVSPVPFMEGDFMQKVEDRIVRPTIEGLQKENIEYKGFVFFGLMNLPGRQAGVNGEPYVIEYNCRMGDPETEVVMPRLKNDLVELFVAMHEGRLNEVEIEYDDRCVATIMAVSGGYPGAYAKGKAISGLDKIQHEASIIFHAGTKKDTDSVVTAGGRVLAVTSYGKSITEAVEHSKKVLEKISFEGMYYRQDIGYEFR